MPSFHISQQEVYWGMKKSRICSVRRNVERNLVRIKNKPPSDQVNFESGQGYGSAKGGLIE